MPPVGIERKWHSSESDIVTRVCKNGFIVKKQLYFLMLSISLVQSSQKALDGASSFGGS